MIIDSLLVFDSAATFSTTTASTNVIDLQNARDLGASSEDENIELMCQIGTAFLSSGSATLNIQFQGAPDNGSGSPGTYVTFAESGVIAVASLVANARVFNINVPGKLIETLKDLGSGTPLPRFLRLNYVVATATMSAGTITSAIVGTRGSEMIQYPSGFTVAN
jgi:hypothetical protein